IRLGAIYFGSHDNYFYSLTPAGTLRWKFLTQGPVISSPAMGDDETIYFTSTDGVLYALKPDGRERWHVQVGSVTPSSPIVGEDGIIYLNAGYHLLSFNRDGKKGWDRMIGPVLVNSTPLALQGESACFSSPW